MPKKKSLRKKLVIDYIKATSFGSPITIEEFSRLCRYKSGYEAAPLITEMLNEGLIERERTPGKSTFSYTVASETRIVKAKAKGLAELAKDFAWEFDSDSLRDFIKYLSEGNKEWKNML